MIKEAVAKAAAKALTDTLDVSEILALCKNGTKPPKRKSTKAPRQRRAGERIMSRTEPKPGSNVGMMIECLKTNANKPVKAKQLAKLLLNRREQGERVSGDIASVGSNVNYLRKKYGYDVETVEVNVYKLHVPKRPNAMSRSS